MKTQSKNKTGNGNNAQVALADLNTQIQELQQRRVGLAEPLKSRHTELRTELLDMETQIRDLDPSWKPEPTKPKAETKIAEIITANGGAMNVEEICQAVSLPFSTTSTNYTLSKNRKDWWLSFRPIYKAKPHRAFDAPKNP